MYAGDEFYPDDVTSGEIDEPECGFKIEWDYDDGVPVRCDKPATDGDRCAEHAGAEQ